MRRYTNITRSYVFVFVDLVFCIDSVDPYRFSVYIHLTGAMPKGP